MVGVERLKLSHQVKAGDTVYFTDREALNNWPHLRNKPGVVINVDRDTGNDSMTLLTVEWGKERQTCFFYRFGKLLDCEITGRVKVIGEL